MQLSTFCILLQQIVFPPAAYQRTCNWSEYQTADAVAKFPRKSFILLVLPQSPLVFRRSNFFDIPAKARLNYI